MPSSSLGSFLRSSLRLPAGLPLGGTLRAAALALGLLALGAPTAQAGGASMRAPVDGDALVDELPAPALPADYVEIAGVFARVHHHPDDRGAALNLARHAGASIPTFAERLGLPLGAPVDIVLAHSQADFDGLQPGAPPDWADGTAWPSRGLIFLRAPDLRPGTDEPLTQVLDHEIVHVLLGQAFHGPVPRWLQEGVAQVQARQYTSETTDALARGLLGGDLMHLEELATGFPADPLKARLAYAQSADVVAYLQNEHGPEALPTLIHGLAAGQGFGASMRDATGHSVDEIDAAWRARMDASDLWVRPLVSETMLLGLGAVVLVVGGQGVRRRSREKLRRMEEEDRVRDELAQALVRPAAAPPPEGGAWRHPVPATDGYWSPLRQRAPQDFTDSSQCRPAA